MTASVLVRAKAQFRLFASGGRGLVATFVGNKLAGWTSLNMPDPVEVAVSGQDANGDEVIYFGSTNGFVYQMEKGTSFDGAPIPATLRLPFNHAKSPRTRKRYRRLLVEVEGATQDSSVTYQVEYDRGAYTVGKGSANTALLAADASYWNTSTWNNFTWSSDTPTDLNAAIDATAKNMGILIYSAMTYDLPYKLTGALIHYDIRRTERGD